MVAAGSTGRSSVSMFTRFTSFPGDHTVIESLRPPVDQARS
jgi:hypothetical protein